MENHSSKTTTILMMLAAIAGVCVVFALGVMVGYQKANFSYRWGENYHRNFGGPRDGFMSGMMPNVTWGKDMVNGHGTVGQVLKIDGQTLVVKDKSNTEKTVTVSDATTIRRGDQTVKLSDMKADDHVMIIGEPGNDGQITAKLIRILP